MSLKDFDFKQFLLQRGELVGLGIAAFLGLVLVLMGSKGFLAGSPGRTASDIQAKSQEADQRINTSTPPADIEQVSPNLLTELVVTPVDPERFALASNLTFTTPVDDIKRRNPEVLSPRDFDVKFLRAAYHGYFLDKDENSIYVVVGENVNGGNQPGLSNPFLGGGRGGMGRGVGPAGGDDPGDSPDAGGGTGVGGVGPGGELGGGGGAGMMGKPPAPLKRKVVQMELKKIQLNKDAKFAEQIYPYQVAVVSAAFPYRQQLENFRKALVRKGTMNELYAAIASGKVPFQFAGFEIQRRVTLPSGRIEGFSEKDQGWKDFDKDFQDHFIWLLRRTPRFEEEDLKFRQLGIIQEGLSVPRPALARGAKYPTKELEIPSLKKSMEDLERAVKERNRPPQLPPNRFTKDKKDLNIFSANPWGDVPDPNKGMAGPAGELGVGPGGQPPRGVISPESGLPTGAVQEEPLIPEYVLVRFLDLTVRPGYSYEYRIRVKMANPNFNQQGVVAFSKLAKEKELVATEWSGTEGKPARVPDSQFFYAVDEKPDPARGWRDVVGDRELPLRSTPVQVHQWLPTLPRDRELSVANWVVLERALVHRGETVGRLEPVEVPVWNYEQETDALAVSARNRTQKVEVDFRVRASSPAVLVDFEGGRLAGHKVGGRQLPADDAPVELLVMAPDGRLIARNSLDDAKDAARTDVHKGWRQWIQDARAGRKTGDKMFNDRGLPRGPGAGGGDR